MYTAGLYLPISTITNSPIAIDPVKKTLVFHYGRVPMDLVFLIAMFVGAGAAVSIALTLLLIAMGKIDV